MVICVKQVLVNGRYGGFRLPFEIADWLRENKGWVIPVAHGTKDYPRKGDPAPSLLMVDAQWSRPLVCTHPSHEDEEIRIDPDVIEGVLALKKKYAKLLAKEDYEINKMSKQAIELYDGLRGLKSIDVKTVYVSMEIESDDGIEKVNVFNDEFFEDRQRWGRY